MITNGEIITFCGDNFPLQGWWLIDGWSLWLVCFLSIWHLLQKSCLRTIQHDVMQVAELSTCFLPVIAK